MLKKAVMTLMTLTLSTGVWSHAEFNPSNINDDLSDKDVYITVGADALNSSFKSVGLSNMEVVENNSEVALVRIKESSLPHLSHVVHEEFKRCGGFFRHDNIEQAKSEFYGDDKRMFGAKSIFADYSINNQEVVKNLIGQVDATQIAATINKLSSFRNRYYKSKHGVQSSEWIAAKWSELVKGRNDASVELYNHPKWPQKSPILTIKGESEEVIIVGGHADSIAGFWGRNEARAPGADDNASGISTITEIIRILVNNNYQPKKTIKFMGYAAEEVGLLGSKEIAKAFKAQGTNVIGVMQLDMTNYNGSNQDIVMMTDFTNAEQNAFIGNLIDTYLPGISWGYDKCGYGCSDHASWNGQGYPASMPFESRKGDMNRNIHTARDTISQSGSNASHASKFAKMGLSFVVELDN